MDSKPDFEVDVLVVGAGIYGAWMAYDAALRGLKVLLIDKGDIANATSSASSKLIHGGLRYLEQFNFSLVKKSIKERQNLFNIAPHRVRPLKFGIPVYKGSRVPAWKYKIGLSIYDWFANLKDKSFKHETFSRERFTKQFSFLKSEKLRKGFTYLDASTDDFRYTLEIVDGAVKAGAELKTYCELISYGQQSAQLKDLLSGDKFKVNFKKAINATGQWTDKIFDSNLCRLSKGIHIILPDINLKHALLLLSPIDQRVFFTIPWYGKTMVGTTDTDYKENPDKVEVSNKDKNYLIDSTNHFLKEPFQINDIISSFAGLRVLKNTEGHPSSVTRDWEWKEISDNIFVSLGGKLTSSREDSSILVDHIAKMLQLDIECKTGFLKFPWAPENYEKWIKETYSKANRLGLSKDQIELLIARHGKRAEEVLNLIEVENSLRGTLVEALQFTKAELKFILKNEYVKTTEDLIRRRFPLILLKKLSDKEIQNIKESANGFLKEMAKDILKD